MIRTRMTAATVVTVTSPMLARVAVQAGLTVARYLRRHGVHAQWIAQWGGAFGTKAKAAYRAANDGNQPRTVREGRNDVAAYDTVEFLDAAMTHYRNHPKAGPAMTAGYDWSRAAAKKPRDARGRFVRVVTVKWVSPAGRQSRKLVAAEAAVLLRTLVRHHHVTGLTVTDSQGRTRPFTLAA